MSHNLKDAIDKSKMSVEITGPHEALESRAEFEARIWDDRVATEMRIAAIEEKVNPVPGMPEMNLAQAVGRLEALAYQTFGNKPQGADDDKGNIHSALLMVAMSGDRVALAINGLTEELKQRRRTAPPTE